ncbi:MAG TPA: hypothetical protein VN619_12085 [Lacisediminihabitans sp.]|nr:hypothetical protein [Lacisediminihabitans sp.]HXD62650.1 hypothetical protein [Lacisediminihabitans sp.]
MRKPLVLVTMAVLSLALVGCGTSAPSKAKPSSSPTPTASATPSAPPPAKQAQPTRTRPLPLITSERILKYCPDMPAVHFDGTSSEVAKVDICTSVASATGTTETANWVNFGQEALLSAYAAPNATVTQEPCVRTAKDPLIVWITDTAGKVYPVYAPVDRCGYPSDDAVAAYRATGLQILDEVDLDANGNPVGP